MNLLALLVYIAVTVGTAALFYCVAARRSRPIYEHSERLQSKSIFRLAAGLSAAVGLLLALVQSFSSTGLDLLGLATVSLTTMLVFILVVSVYTDHAYRMVDRVLLTWGLGLAVALGAMRLFELQSEPITVLYIVSILFSFAAIFVPSLGASDSRAYMILFAAGIPTVGIMYTYYAFLVGIALWILYGVTAAIVTRSFVVSIPLVPYILLPIALAPVLLSLFHGVPRVVAALG